MRNANRKSSELHTTVSRWNRERRSRFSDGTGDANVNKLLHVMEGQYNDTNVNCAYLPYEKLGGTLCYDTRYKPLFFVVALII